MKRLVFSLLMVGLAYQTASTQMLTYLRGQNVSPAFEGWEKNADGSFNMMFGYMNRNWEEEVDVPLGPDNNISPGVPDQGQPTHFLPRRNRFVFKVRVPADWGKKELVWTLTTRGKTERAYATLREDSMVDNIVQASEQGALGAGVSSPAIRANAAPDLTIDTGERRAQIGTAADASCSREGRWCAEAAVWSRLARGRGDRPRRGRGPPTARRPRRLRAAR